MADDKAQGMGDAIKASGTKIAENSATVSLKMLDYAEQNTREAFAAMRAAAGATSLSEVLKVQGDFIREQGGRSMTQAREIGELIAAFGKTAVSPLTGKKD
ncbi:phasin family protein [Sphingobium boeckii]|uniref:Phasin domain-containing protein n=1 Tax=Sphingobium boeckii TaxID=1082345 RepID=A0A7W9AJ03_9SPHN|nr:phasin family protein [Sphingobium boeckii]MBB5686564.1 hypothetical protein [Sphingobium boeckii]